MIKKFEASVLLFLLLLFPAWNQCCARIYDCFLFFNELEILDVRLHELYDHVDKFVIVESVETFRGNPKPLYFEENRQRYERFSDKIIYVVIHDRINTTDPWTREEFQRNQIMRGLVDCQLNDIILISDVDEIVRATALPLIIKSIYQDRLSVIACEQPMYRYFLNVFDKTLWGGTCATTFKYLRKTTPDFLRLNRYSNGWLYPLIPNAGWHFTSMGGLEQHIQKIESFSHSEYDVPESKTPEFIRDFICKIGEIVSIDESFPKFIQDNKKHFLENGFLYGPDRE